MSEVKSSSSYTRPLVEVQSLSQEEEEIVQLLKEFRCFYSTLGIESQISLLKQALLVSTL